VTFVIRVGVHGASGRMGAVTCAAVVAADDLELVATRGRGDELRAFAEARCDVVVDFTTAEAARVALPWLAIHGIHAVSGTTGLTDADLDAFRQDFGDGSAHCLIAANFAISAVLMARFAELAAPWFDTAEIVEYHHNAKVDAPSGTALATARRMADARRATPWAADPTETELLPGARGGAGPSGIRVHGVRMAGMNAHQEVLLGAVGQTLTIRQDSYDRASFMPGVLLACRRIGEFPGLTIGLDALLDV
jgi:4-hydroxy-tetrahydrodipicolinate reductase